MFDATWLATRFHSLMRGLLLLRAALCVHLYLCALKGGEVDGVFRPGGGWSIATLP